MSQADRRIYRNRIYNEPTRDRVKEIALYSRTYVISGEKIRARLRLFEYRSSRAKNCPQQFSVLVYDGGESPSNRPYLLTMQRIMCCRYLENILLFRRVPKTENCSHQRP